VVVALPPPGRRRTPRTLLLLTAVSLAAALPFLPTLGGYFLADDFGLIQLFSQKSWWHVLTLFTNPWWDEIYGFRSDELRPTVALSYQLDWWIGGISPWGYHLSNLVFHVLAALLVYALARWAAELGQVCSALAGALFGVLAVHAEAVAWISGRADSIPAVCFMASVVAYARWRRAVPGGSAGVPSSRRWYWLSLAAFFFALFSKQSAVTLLPALVAYDVLVPRSQGAVRIEGPLLAQVRSTLHGLPWRTYLPFAALTAGYLMLRTRLFGNAIREQQITWERFQLFLERQDTYLQMMAAGVEHLGGDGLNLAVATLVSGTCILAVWGSARGSTSWGALLFVGPVWWATTVGPLAVTYLSARHLYLASAGIAIALAMGCNALWVAGPAGPRVAAGRLAGAGLATALLLGQLLALTVYVDRWNAAARLSEAVARALRDEVPDGALVLLGAPPSGDDPVRWAWVWGLALPFARQPPFTPDDRKEAVSIVMRPEIYCCGYGEWYRLTREALLAWETGHYGPVIALAWETPSGALIRRDGEAIREGVKRLRDAQTPGDMAGGIDGLLRPLGGTGARFRVS